MAEEHHDDADSQQFSQTSASLAGNTDAGKQHHGIERQNDDASHESFLLGNDGENEIVMRDGARQVAEGVLGALTPAFSEDAAGPDGNESLLDIIGVVAQLTPGLGFLGG